MRSIFNPMLFISLFLASISSIAQEDLSAKEVANYKAMHNKAAGTYQIQIINTSQIPAIPLSIIQVVEDNRHLSDTTYVDYSLNMRIMILPKNLVNSRKYSSLKQPEYVSK